MKLPLKGRHADVTANRSFLSVGAAGAIVLLAASLYQTYALGRLTSQAQNNDSSYRYFSSQHEQTISHQNHLLLEHVMPSTIADVSREFADLQSVVYAEYNDLLATSMRYIGPAEFSHSLTEFPGVRESTQELLQVPGLPSPTSTLPTEVMLGVCTRQQLIDERKLIFEKAESARLSFLKIYCVGTVMALIGGLRRKAGRWSKAAFWRWSGAMGLLIVWVSQGLFVEKSSSRVRYIDEMVFRSASPYRLNNMCNQSMSLLSQLKPPPREAMHNLGSYIALDFVFTTRVLYPLLDNEKQRELATRYFAATNPKSGKELGSESIALQETCRSALADTMRQTRHYQSVLSYMLTGVAVLATALVVLGQVRSIREERGRVTDRHPASPRP